MAREKTGGVQNGYQKHGEDVKPLHVRVPVSLLDSLNQLPGIKSENVIEAIRDFIEKK